MRKLHVVGFTPDHDGLIFSTRKGSKSGGFVAAISDELLDLVAQLDPDHGAEAAQFPGPAGSGGAERGTGGRPESALTPREIQARLRAGRSINEVAREAGVHPAWVERFAAPILAEQARIVSLARGLVYSKARLGPSSQPLGQSVAVNLIDRGARFLEEEFDAGWSAYQLHDSVWMVRFRYHSRGRDQEVRWQLDASTGRLQSTDRLASDLGYVEPGRRLRSRMAEAEDAAAVPVPVAADAARADGGNGADAPPLGVTNGSTGPARPRVRRSSTTATSRAAGQARARKAAKAAGAGRPKAASRARGTGPAARAGVTGMSRATKSTPLTGAAKTAGRATGTAKTTRATRSGTAKPAKATPTAKTTGARRTGATG
ncbi:MAG: septation protein SepH, partial [Actinomycetota bacterium]